MTAPASPGASRWPAPLRSTLTRAVLVYGGLALIALSASYVILFSRFQSYDDEGTLLTTLKAFVDGATLYDQIYTQYGPLYYEIWGSLFAITGRPVTSDAARFVVMSVWTSTSVVVGLVAHRITGLLALGAGATATAFGTLYALSNEPMHPVGLVVLLLALAFAAIVVLPARRPLLGGLVLGALLAGLILTKINVGLFVTAGCVLAAALTLPLLRGRAWLRWPVVVAYVLMPVVLLAGDFDTESVRDLTVVIVACAVAVVIAAWRQATSAAGEEDATGRRLALGGLGGLSVGFAVIVAPVLANGTSPAALFDGVVGQALRQSDILSIPMVVPPGAVQWGWAAIAGATIAALLRGGRRASSPWPGIARIVVGLVMWMAPAQLPAFGLASPGVNLLLPAALAWVAVLAVPGSGDGLGMRFARVALPAIAVAQTLQVYPVAGSQVGAAAFAFIPVGAICLADGWRSLQAWSESCDAASWSAIAIAVPVAAAALAVSLVYGAMARSGFSAAVAHRDGAALPFVGANRVHIDPAQRDVYARLAAVIAGNGCTALVGLPSTNSLYLWTSIDPPTSTLPGAWMTQLDDELQQRAVDETRRSRRPCAIRNDPQLSAWMNGRPAPDTPLVRYIQRSFRPAETIGDYVFLLPTRRTR